MPRTVKEAQERLIAYGFDVGESGADGDFGGDTQLALLAFQKHRGLKENGKFDAATMLALFPEDAPQWRPNLIQAKLIDYVLNFLTSKINWAAGALVAAVVLWVNTKFGIQVPVDFQNQITAWLVAGGGALIMVLRTFFNKPKVVQGVKVAPPKG